MAGLRKRAVRRAVFLSIVAILPAAQAAAGERFIDTRDLTRHRSEELPIVPTWRDALTAAPAFPFRQVHARPWSPSAEAVTARPSPLVGMAGYTGAGQITSAGVRLGAKADDTAAGFALRNDKANDYFDGNGGRIDFGYERDTEHLVLRHGRADTTMFTFGAVRDVVEDGDLPNYAVDVRRLEQGGGRVAVDHRRNSGWFDSIHAAASVTEVMINTDNFTLRRPNPAAMLRLPIQHRAKRAELTLARDRDGGRTELGADLAYLMHNSKRESWEYGMGAVSAYRLPWAETWRAGASASHRVKTGNLTLAGGLRYDMVGGSAQDVHNRPNIPGAAGALFYNFSPQDLYRQTYGTTDNDVFEHNVSGRLRAEQGFKGGAGWIDLSRLARSADHGERWYALSGPAALFQVGNPQLDPEKHHKAELGGRIEGGGFKAYGHSSPAGAWRLAGRVANDWVADFISADYARGQSGVLRTTGGVVYRNVDAVVSTVGADFEMMALDRLGVRLNLVGARGRNVTDHRPLYQIDPFELNAFVDWFGDERDMGWNIGAHMRAVAAKKAVDDSTATGSGMDFGGPAGAYATFDLYAGLRIDDRVAVSAGVENLLDKLYREHVAGMPHTPITTVPNAPGRTLFVRTVVAF